MKGSYGIDAPGVIITLFISAVFSFVMGFFVFNHFLQTMPNLPRFFQYIFLITSVCLILEILYMLYSSYIGKRKCLEKAIQNLHSEKIKKVLDIGTGSGLFSVVFAQKFPEAHIDAIDVWHGKDQSKSKIELAQKNATIEGVQDRVTFVKADMRELPFTDETFDLVLASLALHNLEKQEDRLKALVEMVRVLKVGGEVLIVDFRYFNEYQALLQELGFANIRSSGRQFQMFPFTSVIQATKH